jgi:hypothetical protein
MTATHRAIPVEPIYQLALNDFYTILKNSQSGSDNDFIVKQSTIPNAGLGLFTNIPLEEGDFIGLYVGEVLTFTEYHQRYPCTKAGIYCLDVMIDCVLAGDYEGKNHSAFVIDAINPDQSGIVRYINDARDTAKNNVTIKWINSSPNTTFKFPVVLAKRKIIKDEELFLDYGIEYWDEEEVKVTEIDSARSKIC